MPWPTMTLQQLRMLNANNITAQLQSQPLIPNSSLRVMADANAGLCYQTLLYLNWLALQLMPDTAETEWLDRFGTIWVGGRKAATYASGTVTCTGIIDIAVPSGSQLSAVTAAGTFLFITTEEIVIGSTPTPVSVSAITPGAAGNLATGSVMQFTSAIAGVNSIATVVTLVGGSDQESDDELRARVLLRIREPPMGGDATDYVQWALSYPGVTRAWCSPLEMGIGTVTVRFMCDELRAEYGGFPLPDDVDALAAYLDTLRPVAVKDFFVEAPIPMPVNLRISYLDSDIESTRAAIEQSLLAQFMALQVPGATWYRAWSDAGINAAPGVNAYDLVASDVTMPSPGYMAVLGDITFG
jgi:uncharacterized phage protein gp47/JayE